MELVFLADARCRSLRVPGLVAFETISAVVRFVGISPSSSMRMIIATEDGAVLFVSDGPAIQGNTATFVVNTSTVPVDAVFADRPMDYEIEVCVSLFDSAAHANVAHGHAWMRNNAVRGVIVPVAPMVDWLAVAAKAETAIDIWTDSQAWDSVFSRCHNARTVDDIRSALSLLASTLYSMHQNAIGGSR